MSDRLTRIELGNQTTRQTPDGPTVDLRDGLQARIADPLWLLARQRQVGELSGEDAASPVEVRVHAGYTKPDVKQTGEEQPWELLAERSALSHAATRYPVALALARQLQRVLRDANLSDALEPLRTSHPLDAQGQPFNSSALAARRHRLNTGRLCDGLRVYETLRAAGTAALATQIAADADLDAATLQGVLETWAAWAATLVADADPSTTGWNPERLEHSFKIAPDATGAGVLEAREYPGGVIAWWSFDLISAPLTLKRQTSMALLPMPLRYPGMPALRWWELEDGQVHFGDINAGPTDLARVLVAQYATAGADDWYMVPLPLPVGALAHITSIQVVDTFGRSRDVLPAAQLDLADFGEDRPWRFLEFGGSAEAHQWLLALDGTSQAAPLAQTGPVCERVSFVRDENANLVWAIEHQVQGAFGQTVDRDALWWSKRSNPGPSPADSDWHFVLQDTAPPHWIPFKPSALALDQRGTLTRARMAAWSVLAGEQHAGSTGAVVAGAPPRFLFDTEIAWEGVEVTRRWKYARNHAGRGYSWLAHARGPARAPRAAGFEFDSIKRQDDSGAEPS